MIAWGLVGAALARALVGGGSAEAAILDVARIYQQHIGLLEADFTARAWVFQPDGSGVYIQGSGPTSSLVAQLTRDSATGALTYRSAAVHPDGTSPGGFGLGSRLVFGPGQHELYGTGMIGVSVLSLDPATGTPSVIQETPQVVYQGNAPRLTDLAIAPDGTQLSAAFERVIAIYPRAPDGRLGPAVIVPIDTVSSTISSLAMAPDGRFLYAVAHDEFGDDDALLVFARAASSGSLQLVQRVEDNLGDRVSLGAMQTVAMSPDGRHLYVADGADPETNVTVLVRDADSGRVALSQLVTRNAGEPACALGLAVSGDGSLVYVACNTEIGVYHRAPRSGALTLVQTIQDGVDGIDSVQGIDAIAASPDGRSLYVVADALGHNVTEFHRVCGDGVLDPGEACDDGNLTDGDGCDAACRVEPCFSCSGTPSTCTSADGSSCDDGNPCTDGDACQAGVCRGNVVADGTSCDDGDVCTTGDACHGGQCAGGGRVACGTCESCDAVLGCVGVLASECQSSPLVGRHGTLDVRAGSNGNRSLAWRWVGSQATTAAQLGDPVHTTAYRVCLLDHAELPGDVRRRRRVLLAADVPAEGTCNGHPCWQARPGGGFVFRGGPHPLDGISTIAVAPGPALASTISVSGAGAALSLGSLPATLDATMQLSNDAGSCWQADYGTFVRVNTRKRLKANGGEVPRCRGYACREE